MKASSSEAWLASMVAMARVGRLGDGGGSCWSTACTTAVVVATAITVAPVVSSVGASGGVVVGELGSAGGGGMGLAALMWVPIHWKSGGM